MLTRHCRCYFSADTTLPLLFFYTQRFTSLLEYYGEDPTDITPQSYFGTICSFVDKLAAAHHDNEREIKEQRRQQKLLQQKQKRVSTTMAVQKIGMSGTTALY
jgi:hypothetical protein